MSILEPWNIVFAIGFVIYVVTRGIFATRTKGNQKTERRVGIQEKILLPAMLVTGLLFPVVYLFTPIFSFADYALPEQAHWCGLVILIFGLWLFWRSHADLGLNWSPTLEMRKGHQIVTNGVYQKIRHPMYGAIWLFSIGQALLLDNWLAGWSVVLVFSLMYALRTPVEEQMMIDKFGKNYQDYMAQTGRLIPPINPRSRK